MRLSSGARATLVTLVVSLAPALASPARAVVVPASFVVENAVPGVSFNVPTALAFLPDGRMLVAEQAGTVWMVWNGVRLPNPVWNATVEVTNNGDRGILGMTVDPHYFQNHYVYFLYNVDPDSDGVDNSLRVFGRLTRYTMRTTGDTNTVDLSSRTILLGVDWPHGILDASDSHSVGALRFGRDGSLLASAGDGGDYNTVDAGGEYPDAFGPGKTDPYADIGAFRAQDITILNGKILRVNPANGHGYASNPYADSDLTSNRSKVFEYGLRNPFRFTVRPATGSADTTAGNPGVLYIGDVGWTLWEETDVALQGGMNFGWPCFEGFHANSPYQAATPAHNGCGSVGTATNPAPWTLPVEDWHHSDPTLSSPPGITGITSIGGVFYGDTLYPGIYRGRYFFADYGASWIKVATFTTGNAFVSVSDFGSSMDSPVDLETSPTNGDIYYISISTGEIRHIRYTGPGGGNAAPVARVSASPGTGNTPLQVHFTGSSSFDPEGGALTFAWDFGDGGTSAFADPVHTYLNGGTYLATLTVTDPPGAQTQASVVIVVGASASFPSAPVLDNFNRANGAVGANWLTSGGLSVQSNALQVTADVSSVWGGSGPFGADQECFVTANNIASAQEVDLMLKVQGTIWSAGHIEIWWDTQHSQVHVSTFDPGAQWVARGILDNVVLAPGDQIGARARANGDVEVYRNRALLGTINVAGWPFFDQGGRIGLSFQGAVGSTLDDFGGGDYSPGSTIPVADVVSPNGGESWTAGTAHTITWNAADDIAVIGVDLFYRDAPTSAWTPLALNIPNSGSFSWFVPNTPTTTARVRVLAHDGDGNQGEGLSNADFTIVRQPGGLLATTLRDFHMPGTQPFEGGGFETHGTCVTCHGGYNPSVEPGHNFSGTMMSQAAHDPLFYACLAIAEQDAPSSGDLCIRCHSPFAWLTGRSQPTNGSQIDLTGRDGVSCDLCHRLVDPVYVPGVSPPEDQSVLSLLPAHVPTSYGNGQYVVDPSGQHRGPYLDPVTPHSFLMSPFHEKSEMCATCHDVSNPVYARVGASRYAAGPLDAPADSITSSALMPLERTFSEWKNSAFPSGVVAPQFAGNHPGGIVSSCQDCHMREVTGHGCASPSAPLRNDLPLHDMTGGNAWMGGVVASLYPGETDSLALKDAAARATAMLGKAAVMQLTVAAEADSFRASVKVTNQTGHKLPTGYPEGRRMWLDVRARNAAGQLVYESGAYDASTGTLAQNATTRVWEVQLGLSSTIASGTGLTSGPSFHFVLNDTLYKDNRIPPRGFTNAAFAAFGGAPVDPQGASPRYADGQNWDVATYALPKGATNVTATLFYQTASKDYVQFLQATNSTNAAGQAMLDAWASHGRSTPVAMAYDSVTFNVLAAPPPQAPAVLSLRPARNPFSGPLELTLALPHAANVRMDVLDVSGRMVARLPRGRLSPGEYRLAWDGHDASGADAGAGVFWVVVRLDDRALTRRVVRLR